MSRVTIIDNYDSFTYNLAQMLAELGASVTVHRNDRVSVADIIEGNPSHLVLSPGPGQPEETGVTLAALAALAGKMPILGVCLGHQAIGRFYGGRVVRSPAPVHGMASAIGHDGETIFSGLESPLAGGRYHSLVVADDGLPPQLEVSARTADGLVMGVRDRAQAVEGLQFHPESILTPEGRRLLANFLTMAVAR
ncbi:MAG: anthranilate synthase component II [Candidatus Geothermincolia bacterium]